MSDCPSPLDNGGTPSNGDGIDDIVVDGVGADATNRDGVDLTGGSTCLDIEGMLLATSFDVVVNTTPCNWVGILTLVGDGDGIGVGLGVGAVILGT